MDSQQFYTKGNGTGGRIKKRISDFLVKEITTDKTTCEIKVIGEDGVKKTIEKNWPENNGEEQLTLTLEKYNTDLNNVIRELSRKLYLSAKRFGYAGMKDKRAITSQKISIWKPDYQKVKDLRSKFIDVYDAKWSDKRIELGDLFGNEFEITIREIDLPEKKVEKIILDCFKQMENGIPNYFGLQRFGGIREITHLVGKEIIKGDLETAVMIYLTQTAPEEDEQTKNARTELAQTKDFSTASKNFPNELRFERAIIHHLCKYPKDYAGSLQKLPKQLRIMFTHAFQSYLFNKIINTRLEQGLGLGEIEGDILIDGVPSAALFGFESKLAEGKMGEIEKEILQKESLELSDFKIKKLSELSSKGTRKQLMLTPQKMKLLNIEKDEFTEGCLKATVSFSLTKGNYATTVVREIMKKEPR